MGSESLQHKVPIDDTMSTFANRDKQKGRVRATPNLEMFQVWDFTYLM